MQRVSAFRLFLPLFFLIGSSTSAVAQRFTFAISPTFEEPKDAGTRVFQCDNGNTLLLGFLPTGLRVIVYNASRKPGPRAMHTPATWGGGNMKSIDVKGIFNFGDEVVMFVQTTKGSNAVLTRINISSQDGTLLSYATLAESSNQTFFVQKVSERNAYTVAMVSNKGNGKQIKLLHFEGTHRETGRDSFASMGKFKFVNCLGIASRAPGEGIFCFYEYNTSGTGGKESRFVLTSFRKGKFAETTIDSAREMRTTDAIILYNSKAKLYEIVTATAESTMDGSFSSSTNEYSSLVIGIRPDNFKLAFVKSLDESPLDSIKKERFGSKANYSGLPVNAVAGADGSLTVITESMALTATERNTNTTYLGDIGLMKYDVSGTLISSTLVPSNKIVSPNEFDPLYQKGEDVSKAWFHHSAPGTSNSNTTMPGYYYSRYVVTSGGNFVFTNQHEDDFDQGLTKSPTGVRDLSSSNAVGFRTDAGELKSFHLFGKPGVNFENRFALFSSGDYSSKTGSFAVVIVERKKHEESRARIAWLQGK